MEFGANAQGLQHGCPSFQPAGGCGACVQALQGHGYPWQLAPMWSVAHLGVRSRRLRLHVRARCMWVPGGQRWSDAVGCGLPFATQALRNASDRHAEAWVCLVNQCAVSLRPCASPSLAQCLRGPVQAWLSKARRHAQARCSSVSECTAQLRPDASARKKTWCAFLGHTGKPCRRSHREALATDRW